ncbi:Protein ASP-7 [Aphelenchoides avenae]|nr:Protein ASP-7 [Aphelenchus avenae]
MRAPTIVSIFALLAGDCFAALKPVSVPVTIVPIAFSGKTDSLDDVFLTVNVDVGTPAFRMNLTLDFDHDQSYLFDSAPASLKCYPVAPRHYYNGSASSTFYQPFFNFMYSGYWLRYPYGGDCNSNPDSVDSAYVAQDTWMIGAQPVPSVTFIYGQNHSSLLSNRWASDGILGFFLWGLPPGPCGDDYDDRCDTAVVTLLKPYDENVVSLYLQRPTSPVTTSVPSGSLTFGGRDTEHCSGWTSLDKHDFSGSWSAKIDRVTLGARVLTKERAQAVFDPTSEFIYTASYEDIAHALNAEYDFPSDSYVVPCDALKSFADIVFSLSGKDYRLPASDYARQTSSDAGKKTCTLMFLNYPSWSDANTWTIGTTFLRNYCLALDFSSGLVAVARAL